MVKRALAAYWNFVTPESLLDACCPCYLIRLAVGIIAPIVLLAWLFVSVIG